MIQLLVCGLRAATGIAASAQDLAATPTASSARLMPMNTLLATTPVEEISSKKIDTGSKVRFVTIGDVSENVGLQRRTGRRLSMELAKRVKIGRSGDALPLRLDLFDPHLVQPAIPQGMLHAQGIGRVIEAPR